jgi:hypothetical protein
MKISTLYQLNKTQAELDFVDIDTSKDMPLFVDPHFLGQRTDRWSLAAILTIKNFFQTVIDLIRAGRGTEAKPLFDHLGEVNSTCLGLSKGSPEGRGVGPQDAHKIFEKLLKSRAVQTGLLQDLEDSILFIDRFGKDKLSDMTTNIIRKHLLDYTIRQCDLNGIQLTNSVPSGYFWDRNGAEWKTEYTQVLIIDERPILLVPKGIVSFSSSYISEKYYRHYVLTFLQNEELRINSLLVKKRKDGTRYVTKKDVESKYPLSKEFLVRFTAEHPEILDKFKSQTGQNSLKNVEISEINVKNVCKRLGEQLVAIPVGAQSASEYHKQIIGILELLLYPKLINPVKEREIHSGRKRVDIIFDNAAKQGVFEWIAEKFRIICPYVFVECKNYKSDPANPELDQLSGRFSSRNGKLGLLLCRRISDKELFYKRCQDTYNDDRGLIIPLDDRDLINLLDNFNEMNDSFIEKYLQEIINKITL